MATKYVTLKDSNGDTLYPQAVATNLAPGSITGDKIDWSSSGGVIKTITDQNGTRSAIYFGDGTMIVRRKVTGVSDMSTAIGSLYYADVPPTGGYWALAPAVATGADDFIESPTVSFTVLGSSTQYLWLGAAQGTLIKNATTSNRWSIPAGAIRLFRATSHSAVNWEIDILAIGRWK